MPTIRLARTPNVIRIMLAVMLSYMLVALVTVDAATIESVYKGKDGVAISGYDAVAYHTQVRPLAGKAKHAFSWNGAIWHFASAENRDRFAAHPVRWAPQYGGYCAWAVAHGYVASTDPQAWRIVDKRLYLNYSLGVRARWERDTPQYIRDADKHWSKLSGQ